MSDTNLDRMARFSELRRKHIDILEQIAQSARSLTPVLKDHNLNNTAKPLEELLFQLDANRGEQENLIKEDPDKFMASILARLRGPGGGAA
jgi:hypothetical protein